MTKKVRALALLAAAAAVVPAVSLSTANAGWYVARQLAAGEGAEWAAAGAVGYAGGEAGAWAGAELGAMVGTAGGPIGSVVGGMVGAGLGAL